MWILKYRYFFASLLLATIFIFGLLKGPVVPDQIQSKNCARNVNLPLNFGLTLNCDSGIYLRLASNLNLLFENSRIVNGRLLTPGNVEQSTPGSSIFVWLISKPINLLWGMSSSLQDKIIPDIRQSLNQVYDQLNLEQTVDDSLNNFNQLIPTYVAYILYNVFIIIFCFILYNQTLRINNINIDSSLAVSFLIGMIILINDVNKQFFFSPGPQIFRILCPIFTIYFASKIIKETNHYKNFLLGSILSGFLMLFYYIFFVCFITLIFSFLLKLKMNRNLFINKLIFSKILISLVYFILPSMIWFIFCLFFENSLVVADMTHDGFGFFILMEKIKNSGLIHTLIYFSDSILRTFHHSIIHSWIIVFLLFVGLIIREFKLDEYQRTLLKISIFFSISSILFFAFYSPVTSRMVYSGFLVFIPFIGELYKEIKNKKKLNFLLYPAMFSIFFIYTFKTVNKTEPYGWYDEKGKYFFIRE